MKVKLVSMTQIDDDYYHELMKSVENNNFEFIENIKGPEALMAYVARVSSKDQTNSNYAKLLGYCAKHGHWSVFETVDATFEIETSRAIAQQILRHRSFTFQEFSQRYAKVELGFEVYEARRQDTKNRQNSINDMDQADREWFREAQQHVNQAAFNYYCEALDRGVAKEQARFLLPLSTRTKIYMKGALRSWIHYVDLRGGNGTQKEHQDIALEIKSILGRKFPVVAEAMNWNIN